MKPKEFAIHPGEVLADELQELDVTPSDLARAIDVPLSRIRQIIQGKRSVTADTALRLGQWFGTGPEIWLDFQTDYDLRTAKEAIRDELKAIARRPGAPKEKNVRTPL